jgi:hypothetical protein
MDLFQLKILINTLGVGTDHLATLGQHYPLQMLRGVRQEEAGLRCPVASVSNSGNSIVRNRILTSIRLLRAKRPHTFKAPVKIQMAALKEDAATLLACLAATASQLFILSLNRDGKHTRI